jgi:hypothetical protein
VKIGRHDRIDFLVKLMKVGSFWEAGSRAAAELGRLRIFYGLS